MSIVDFFKKQLGIVIEWTEQNPDILFYRIPTPTSEVKNASKLIVSPGQGCVLVYDGRIVDTITDNGVFDLRTSNHPFITNMVNVYRQFESEHKMHIYYFRSAQILNLKWGTSNPIKYLDPTYKLPLELGAYGNYSASITDAKAMFINIVGSRSLYTTTDMKQLISSRITSELASLFAQLRYSYIDIDSNLSEASSSLGKLLNNIFATLGFQLLDFRVEATNFDEATQRRIGEIADMTTANLSAEEVKLSYVDHQKVQAMRDISRSSGGGGIASTMFQAGMGLQMGRSMAKDAIFSSEIGSQSEDPIEQLQKLKKLVDEGILTSEEFEEKKKEILKRI